MQFDLTKELDRNRFQDKCAYYLLHEKKIELIQRRKKRSINQNSYLHLIFSWFAHETGYSSEEVKQDIWKREVCKDIFIKEKGGRNIYRSSADLDTGEMTNAIEKFRNWSSLQGIYLPSPNEDELLREMDSRIRQYGIAQYL